MNSIIYTCFDPEQDKDCLENSTLNNSEEKIFIRIFEYLDVIFKFVQPKKLFFIAVDGVSPCAKTNSQRGGLFSSYRVDDEQVRILTTIPATFECVCTCRNLVFLWNRSLIRARLNQAQSSWHNYKNALSISSTRSCQLIQHGRVLKSSSQGIMYVFMSPDSHCPHLICYRFLVRESTRLWTISAIRRPSQGTILTPDTVYMVLMLTWLAFLN